MKNKNSKINYKVTSQQMARLDKALSAHSSGNLSVAETEYRSLLAENLEIPQLYSQLAVLCAMTSRTEEAKELWNKALTIDSNFADAHLGLGDIHRNEGQHSQAIVYYQTVIKQNSKHSIAYQNLSFSLVQLGELDKAEAVCKKCIKATPSYIPAQDNLAQILIAGGKLKQAEYELKKNITNNPRNFSAKYILGNLLKSLGNIKSAANYYQQVIRQKPDHYQAHFTYSSIHKYKKSDDPHLKTMKSLYEQPLLTTEAKILLSFSLAKAFEDIAEFSQSMIFLLEGNQLRSQKYNYNIEGDKKLISNIISTFTRDIILKLQQKGNISDKPIFIVGMPRSGTTLVEKIIASHSDVYGAGELDYFFKLGANNFLDPLNNYLFNGLETYPADSFMTIGDTYIESIESLNKTARKITDKLPLNILMVGLIKMALPNAKIIHCTRNPIDTCLSIYKQLFTTDNYQFAYNQTTLAQYHNLYRELMYHWHTVIPDSIYEISYESLTHNPEDEIKKLIEYCDLEWQDTCLNFSETEAVVKTASSYQVRQPMYSSSVNLWEKYKEFLQPLINELNL